MQAKDIPDDLVIDLVSHLRDIADEEGWVGGIWPSTQNIVQFFSAYNVPEKVVMAKLKKLVKRGILDGCACGCSGNFSVIKDIQKEGQ